MRAHTWTPGEDASLVHGYENGEPIESMHKRMRIGRSSIYRRLKDLGVPPREPRKKSPGYYVPIKIYEHTNPLVRQLFDKAREEYSNLVWLSARSGLTREAIGAWGKGSEPTVGNLQAVGNCVGLELVWQEIDT